MKSTPVVETSTPAAGRRARAWRVGMALFAACAPAIAGDLVPSKDCAAGKCAQLRIDENFQVSRQILSGVPVEQAEWPAAAAPAPSAAVVPAGATSASSNPWLVAALALGAGMLLQFLLSAATRRRPVALPAQRPVSPPTRSPAKSVIAAEVPAPAPVQALEPVNVDSAPVDIPVQDAVAEAPLPDPIAIVSTKPTVAAEAMPEAPATEIVAASPEALSIEAAVASELVPEPVAEDSRLPPIDIAWTPDPAEIANAVAVETPADGVASPEAIAAPSVAEEMPATVELSSEAAPVGIEAPVACETAQELPVAATAIEPIEISATVAETPQSVTPDAEPAPAVAEGPAIEPEVAAPAETPVEPEPEPILVMAAPEPVAVAAPESPAPAQPETARAAPTPREEQTVALLRRLAIQRSRTTPDERHASVFRLITQGQFVRAERVLLELEQPAEEEVIPSWSVTTAEHIALRRERELQQKLDGLRSRVYSEPGRRRLAVADAHLRRSRLDEAAEALEELEGEVLGV